MKTLLWLFFTVLLLVVPASALLAKNAGQPDSSKPGTATVQSGFVPVKADTPLAKVGEKVLTLRDLTRFVSQAGAYVMDGQSAQGMARNLQRMVDVTLLKQAARKEGMISRDKSKKDNEIGLYRLETKYFPIQKTFREEELRQYYELHKEDFGIPARVRIAQILFRVPEQATDKQRRQVFKQAEEVRRRLVTGESFEQLAREFSGNRKGQNSGGDLGFVNRNSNPWLRQVLEGLRPGDLSPVVESPAGYEIVKLIEERAPLYDKYEVVQRQVALRLARERQTEARQRYLSGLTREIGVTYYPAGLRLISP